VKLKLVRVFVTSDIARSKVIWSFSTSPLFIRAGNKTWRVQCVNMERSESSKKMWRGRKVQREHGEVREFKVNMEKSERSK